jgi:hypothetical protein
MGRRRERLVVARRWHAATATSPFICATRTIDVVRHRTTRAYDAPVRDRLLRDGYWILAVVFVLLRLFAVEPWDDSVDAYAYRTTGAGHYYDAAQTGVIGAYLYSPAFAQVVQPFTFVSWHVFVAAWTALSFALLWWMLGRLALPSLLFLPVSFEIISGNVHLLIAACIVAGFRWSAVWALPILTKVTPGVGLLWFLVRREWRPLGIALGSTLAITALSFLLDPEAWRQWIRLLTSSIGDPVVTKGWYVPVPLLIRLPVAAVVIVWGALTDRRWTVPVGVTLALPILWSNGLAVLVAVVPLVPWRFAIKAPAALVSAGTPVRAGSTS